VGGCVSRLHCRYWRHRCRIWRSERQLGRPKQGVTASPNGMSRCGMVAIDQNNVLLLHCRVTSTLDGMGHPYNGFSGGTIPAGVPTPAGARPGHCRLGR
jgi:hypothetical protein